jgi:hypothetical protein
MPPRYAYWTILIDGKATAFRAREREELLPTFNQLARKNADIAMRYFARGRLWDNPEQAQWPTAIAKPHARSHATATGALAASTRMPRARFEKKRDRTERPFHSKDRKPFDSKERKPSIRKIKSPLIRRIEGPLIRSIESPPDRLSEGPSSRRKANRTASRVSDHSANRPSGASNRRIGASRNPVRPPEPSSDLEPTA